MPTDTVSLTTRDGAMPSFLAEPEPDAPVRGAVVVIHEAFGVTSHIENVCRRLADEGFTAIAPSLFHRLGSPLYPYDDFPAAEPAMKSLEGEDILTDVDAALARLGQLGFPDHRIAIIGFCMGGTVAMFVATARSLGAAVTFYGAGVAAPRFKGVPPLLEIAPQLRAPWLGHYGDRDRSIPVEQVESLRQAVARAGVETEIVRYAAAGHAFHNDERSSVYVSEAAAEAWERTVDWLAGHLAE